MDTVSPGNSTCVTDFNLCNDTINTKQMGQTDEALDELQMHLHEHAAQITEQNPPSSKRLGQGSDQ